MQYKEIAYGDDAEAADWRDIQDRLDLLAFTLYEETGLSLNPTVYLEGTCDVTIYIETEQRVLAVLVSEDAAVEFFNRLIDGTV